MVCWGGIQNVLSLHRTSCNIPFHRMHFNNLIKLISNAKENLTVLDLFLNVMQKLLSLYLKVHQQWTNQLLARDEAGLQLRSCQVIITGWVTFYSVLFTSSELCVYVATLSKRNMNLQRSHGKSQSSQKIQNLQTIMSSTRT